MKKRVVIGIFALAGVALLLLFVSRRHREPTAASAPLPAVQEVMDRYVRALGGRDAIFEHTSMTIRGTFELSEKGPSLDRTVYYKQNRMRFELRFPHGGLYEEGFDGSVAWRIHPKNGPSLPEGDEIKAKARDADMYYPARVLDYFGSMEVVDVAEFEGHSCFHLRGVNKWGKVNEQFYDTTTGLLIGYRFNSSWRGGSGDESEVFSDYKDFGGWRMPTRIAHKHPDGRQTEITASVTFDDVDDGRLALPEKVKSLQKKG